nr:MAG TPA: chromosome partition protein [Caudoviricetes sp.]
MFKIDTIILIHKNEKSMPYKFTQNTFIYGQNSLGKTGLTKIINFILGCHDKNPLMYDGLDNIDEVEALLTNNNTKLWVKRSIFNDYQIKITEDSEYISVTDEQYIEYISNILYENIKIEYLDIYKKIFQEKLSYRSLSFLNFIDEKGLGNLSKIFTRAQELKYQIKINKIMRFFFNYSNIEKLYNKEKALEEWELKDKQLNPIKEEYEKGLKVIKELFNELQLVYDENMEKNIKRFNKFKQDFSRESKSSNNNNPDIAYAARASLSLSEEIKLYNFLKNQSLSIKKRNKKVEVLLNILQNIVSENPEYKKYVRDIENIIKEIQDKKILLNVADYNVSIKKIKEEKEGFDKLINDYKSQMIELDYDTTIKKIGLLEYYLSKTKNKIDEKELDEIKDNIKKLKEIIKNLNNSFDKRSIDLFNKYLLNEYKKDEIIKYVSNDFKQKGFKIEFNPLIISLEVSYLKRTNTNDDGEKSNSVHYIPGSMARQTHLQILTYLSMFKYLKDNFEGLPYLPLLVMDSVNQPFESKIFNKFYPHIIEIANKVGIQTIFMSKEEIPGINDSDKIILTEGKGLNPFHEK